MPARARKIVYTVTPKDIGRRIRVDYGKDNVNNRLLHVRGVVDDKVIMRRWRASRRSWGYEMIDNDAFQYTGGAFTWA